MLRLLYHVMRAEDPLDEPYSPPSLAQEGFVHCSYLPSLAESARLYFPPDVELRVLEIDPSRLGCEVRVVATPRGPMPHVHGAIPRAAIVRSFSHRR
jgi:uncharacterized protein (DUF952 family)